MVLLALPFLLLVIALVVQIAHQTPSDLADRVYRETRAKTDREVRHRSGGARGHNVL